MADLLSYRGDANLGLGANASIPAISGQENLNLVNQTARDIMLLDNQQNVRLFQQKVQDRDNLTALILQNQTGTGDILPEYLPAFNEATKRAEKAYLKWGGNFNDTKGFSEYQKAITDLKDVSAHAQVNTKSYKDLSDQAAKETLPFKKDQILKFQKEQLANTTSQGGFFNQINPFQPIADLDLDYLGGDLTGTSLVTSGGAPTETTQKVTNKTTGGKTTTTVTDIRKPVKRQPGLISVDEKREEVVPVAGKGGTVSTRTKTQTRTSVPSFTHVTEQFYDYDIISKKAQRNFLEPESKESYYQDQLLGRYQQYLDSGLNPNAINEINERIALYNEQRGLSEGEKGYAPPVKVARDNQTGQLIIADSQPDFAAKWALANIKGNYFNRDVQFDYDNYVKSQELAIKRGHLGVEQGKLALSRKKYADEQKRNEFDENWDAIGNIGNNPVSSSSKGGFLGNVIKGLGAGDVFRINVKDIPGEYRFVGGISDKGAIQLLPKKRTLANGEVEEFYDKKFFVPKGTILDGKRVERDTELTISDLRESHKKFGGGINFEDYTGDLFRSRKIDFILEGANGTGTRRSSYDAQQYLRNKNYKNYQTPLYDYSESEQ